MSIADSVKQGLLYRVWKFKQFDFEPFSGELGMVSVPFPEIFDLTIVGTLLYNDQATPAKFEIGHYELINDSIVMVMPYEAKVQIEYKISELTEHTLKLTMHFKMDDQLDKVDTDVVVFVFEAE